MALPARAQTGALRSYILVRLEVCAHGSARRAVGAGGEAGPRYARSLARASLPLPARSSVAGARRRSVCRAFAPRLIWSSATSTRPSRTAFGRRTSPISGPGRLAVPRFGHRLLQLPDRRLGDGRSHALRARGRRARDGRRAPPAGYAAGASLRSGQYTSLIFTQRCRSAGLDVSTTLPWKASTPA